MRTVVDHSSLIDRAVRSGSVHEIKRNRVVGLFRPQFPTLRGVSRIKLL